MRNLYTTSDVKAFSQAFGSLGMNRAQMINIQNRAANQNELEVIPVRSINISLVKMIDQLSVLDGYLKQKLDNQKTVDKNLQLSERESQIESQTQKPEVIRQDAERVGGSSAGGLGLLGLGAVGLLAFEPVREALSGLVGLAVDAGKFATKVLSSINGLFASMFGGTPDTSAVKPVEGNTAKQSVTPAPTGEGTTQTETPVTTQAVPEQKSSFVTSTLTGAIAGGAAGAVLPFVRARTGAVVGAAVGAYSYFSSPSTQTKSTPSGATGGAVTAPTSPEATTTTKPKEDAKKENKTGQQAEGNVIQVNHTETGQGWGIAGAVDSNGRPIAFSKEGAVAFSKMMQDSNGVVKPSDVASSKRSVQKNNQVGGAKNSPHLRGVAMDIHGSSGQWIRQHGHKYGWKPHDYKGTHGGHFVFGGAGMVPDEGSSIGGMVGQAASAVSDGIEQTAKVLGAIAGVLVGKTTLKNISTPLVDNSSIIQDSSMREKVAIAQSKVPKIPARPSPPNINMSGTTGTIQNPPTMSDRNRLYYYIDRFNFGEVNKPTVLAKSATG